LLEMEQQRNAMQKQMYDKLNEELSKFKAELVKSISTSTASSDISSDSPLKSIEKLREKIAEEQKTSATFRDKVAELEVKLHDATVLAKERDQLANSVEALTKAKKDLEEKVELSQRISEDWKSKYESTEKRAEELFLRSQEDNTRLMEEINIWKQKYHDLATEKASVDSQLNLFQEKHRIELERRENLTEKVEKLQQEISNLTKISSQDRIRLLEEQSVKDADVIVALKSQVNKLKVSKDFENNKADEDVDEETRSSFQQAQMFFAARGESSPVLPRGNATPHTSRKRVKVTSQVSGGDI